MATRITTPHDATTLPRMGLIDRLNGVWHKPALLTFTAIVLGHWAEHLTQAFQIYVLKWPLPKALGFLGLFYPWLVKSEVLHYVYALVMLVGIWGLPQGIQGSRPHVVDDLPRHPVLASHRACTAAGPGHRRT